MPVLRTYACSECSSSFEVFHKRSDEPPPRFCMSCGFDFEGGSEAAALEVQLPKVNLGGSELSKSVEQTYRTLEASSGVTNLRDGLRPGEVAARPVDNIVTQTMKGLQEAGGISSWQGGGGSIGAALASSGPKGQRGAESAISAIQRFTPRLPPGPSKRL